VWINLLISGDEQLKSILTGKFLPRGKGIYIRRPASLCTTIITGSEADFFTEKMALQTVQVRDGTPTNHKLRTSTHNGSKH